MQKLITLFCLSLLAGVQLFSMHDQRANGQLTTRDTELSHLQAELNASMAALEVSGRFGVATTPAHACSRALSTIGDMYVVGSSNLSLTEGVVLTQVRWVSNAALVGAVIGAAAHQSDFAQKAAVVGILSAAGSVGYKFWRGYSQFNIQR